MSGNKNHTVGAEGNAIREDYVVGIGASAGGLEALQKLLTALPHNTGFPYIIVQHLSPDYRSLLSEILSKYTQMPVAQVEDGIAVKPNHVYVIQPGKNMRIHRGRLFLSEQQQSGLNLPIDMFFRSLASEAGARAIAIILSGTGSDGSNGIRDIKENDGMIIVQDLESSKFDGMPRSAMRTGLADAQMTPEEIALELKHISSAYGNQEPLDKTEDQLDNDLMKRIFFILKKSVNVNFTHYKPSTIQRRISRRMMLTHTKTLRDYVTYLYESPAEVKILSKEVLIGVTSFFRDAEHFRSLREKAIRDIVARGEPEDEIRVWVAGCSTGEEAYSIAILFMEEMDEQKKKRNVKIFATDLDVESIGIAGRGVYGDNIAESVSPARLSRYFTRRNNTYTVSRELRKMIVFSPHNVFQDPPFGRLDLISCRNMLIYFQPVLQNDLFAIFHVSLKNGGYLFLGKSENVGTYTDAFSAVDSASRIYMHKGDAQRLPGRMPIPYLSTTYMEDESLYAAADAGFYRDSPAPSVANERAPIDNAVLEQYMPACLVFNEKNELIHSYGDCGNYVHMPPGRFTNNLFEIIAEGLKIPVSTLLKESREKKRKVQYKGICYAGEQDSAIINITVTPVGKKGATDNLHALIITEHVSQGDMAGAEQYDVDRVASRRIMDLEQELGVAQEKLGRSQAEQECVNEELQAANEELLTANEELQSSNEELQSVNEELYTVNSEYQTKLTELADLNDDITNFLASTLIGIIFVDNKLNIRRYTDYVTTEFSVMDHDIGRSLQFISYHFPTVDIAEICNGVLKTLVPDEREITTGKDKVFFMRVAPYRSTEDKILGCVITLVDVTGQKQGQAKLQSTEKRLSMAEKASHAKSDYLTHIVREIRTPVDMLLSFVDEAKARLNHQEDAGAFLNKIAETAEYISSIISDIPRPSDDARADGAAGAFTLKDVVDRALNEITPRARAAGLTVESELNANPRALYEGDQKKLDRILMVFLDNAVQFTPEGGGITLKAYEETEDDGGMRARFVITDTGVGIQSEYLPVLFKPFTRENSAEAGGGKSMGLGLSIADNLIRSMDGDVSVKSEVGKGSEFTVRVALNRVAERNPARAPRELNELRAMIVEDNMLNRTILGALLSAEGITYDEACDGEQAVQMYTDSPDNTYDFILMDMRMPKLDGIRATMAIRDSQKADARTIPIIGVSANSFEDDVKKARQAGIDEYTTKPIDKTRLFSAIDRLVLHKE